MFMDYLERRLCCRWSWALPTGSGHSLCPAGNSGEAPRVSEHPGLRHSLVCLVNMPSLPDLFQASGYGGQTGARIDPSKVQSQQGIQRIQVGSETKQNQITRKNPSPLLPPLPSFSLWSSLSPSPIDLRMRDLRSWGRAGSRFGCRGLLLIKAAQPLDTALITVEYVMLF